MSTKQVNQQKEPVEVEIMEDNLKMQVCKFRRSVCLAVGEVSAALANHDQLKGQNGFVNSRLTEAQIPQNNPQALFKNSLTAYLEIFTSKNGSLKIESAIATKAKQLMTAAAGLYRSFGGGGNETIK